MWRFGWMAFALTFLMSAATTSAQAEKRVALVIGNSGYKFAGELRNPKNDAADMAAALKRFGFQVIDGVDLDKVAFDKKIREFGAALANADAGIFFYSGHGLQVAGQNYLVPVDAKAETGDALDFEMVRLELVQRTMERTAATNVLFLDACRNNPLARNLARAMGTRSTEIGRGLAPVESGVGTLISFSTQPGNVALDGSGRNSPFAGALVRHIANSADSLSDLLIAVRNDVRKETDNKQVPWEHSSLTGRFYFNTAISPSPSHAAPPALPELNESATEWSRVDKTSIAELETFLHRHASSPEAEYARARLADLIKPSMAKAPVPQPRNQDVPGGPFDGTWQFTVHDLHGCTDPSHATFSLTISNDVISGGGERPATGRVNKAGKITFSRPGRIVKGATQHYVGQFNGNSGSGRFAGAGQCAGRFSATRQ